MIEEIKRIRVLLADDLGLIRQGIRSMVSTSDEVEIVGEAGTADDAAQLGIELRPDVILMDEDMPGNSIRATQRVKHSVPHVEVIMMTERLDDAKALQAIEAGATGYVLKDIPMTNLIGALRSVCNGRAFFHPEVARKLMERLAHLSREQRGRMRLETDGLTNREMDVLMELAQGATDREIAARFVVSEGTIKTHIHNILRKLGVRNRTQAVAAVLRKGLIR